MNTAATATTRTVTMRDDEDTKYHQLDQETDGPIVKSVEGYILCITGIHEEAQEEDLQEVFTAYGEIKNYLHSYYPTPLPLSINQQIKNLHLNLNRRTGYVKGYAFIEYETIKEARKAIDKMDGQLLLGQKIRVDWAFKKAPSK